MRGNLRVWRLTGAVVAGAMLLTACGGGDSTDDADTGDDAAAADDTAEGGDDDADAGTAEGENVLRVALNSDIDLLEPHFFRTDAAYTVTAAAYEPLIVQTYEEVDGYLDGMDEYEGGLAESWEISDDGLEATFTLREDLAFANGSPLTAEDVKYVYQRAIEGPGYIAALLPFIGVSDADQIEVVDDRTLVFRPEFASPLFERFISFQVFGAMDAERAESEGTDDDPWATEFFTDEVTASGPYTLDSLERGRQATLVPNPEYHSPEDIANDGVVIRVVPNAEERALLLRSGDIDVAEGLPPRTVSELEDAGEVQVHRVPSSRISYLGMNNAIEPFDDPEVRRAISTAIPYDAIRDQVMFGYAEPAYGPVPPSMETAAGEQHWDYDTDLEAAQQMLADAGVEDLTVELAVLQGAAQDGEAAVFIQDSLRQIGVDVEVSQLSDADFNERLNAGELPMFIHNWYSWGEDPFFQMQFLLQSESFTNYARYDSPELDALIDEGTVERDPDRRAQLSEEAQQVVIEDAPWAFLYSADHLVVTGPDVSGVALPYDKHLRFQFMERG
jgi:peptide/nickel transport system substrate-binding protein